MSSLGEYDTDEIEERWIDEWEEMEIFKFDPDAEGEIFSIDTPPRYSSGFLHMGHAKNYLEFEMVGRAMRMLGYNVFFPVGYDDNGLPTEKYVEEELGVDKRDVTREEFIRRCKEAAYDLEDHMTRVFRRIGMSWDWSTLYRTIEDKAVKTAQRSFLDLYDKGEVYRNDEPTIWCPYHKTALAQAEVEDKERETLLNYLHFELEKGGKIEIATTRPELLPSCVAVFVHPDDERHRDLVGKKVKVPIFEHEVPIMEGEEVDPEFGSGMVMVCTFGDNTDVEMWKKYDLPLRISIDEEGKLNENGEKYEGMEVEDAKNQIIEDLKEKGIIFDQKTIEQSVGTCWRCENPVEFIPTQQWFIKILDHRKKMLELGDEIDWYPSYYKHRYSDWVENLKWDWCISRQRYFGVPFPIWYCENCEEIVLADEDDLPVDPRTDDVPSKTCDSCGSEELHPEMDVMDTWMTSSMTPHIATGWKDDEDFFQKAFPMTLRPQSHDIIRNWAFYTMLKSHLHSDSIPWEDVMVSGYVYTEEGVGMSSSKGTGVSPEKIIEENGADCLRYWAAGAGTGEDIVYKEKDVIRGRKILTKIWNAANLVGMHLDDLEDVETGEHELTTMDRWILGKTKKVVDSCEEHYRDYESSKVRRKISDFFKNVFCDDYLEMVKYRLYDEEDISSSDRQAALYTLHRTLLANLKVMAPIIPFITEEIYQQLFKDREGTRSIHETSWPEIPESHLDEGSERIGGMAREMISEIRKWKSDNGIPLNENIGDIGIITPHKEIDRCEEDIVNTVKADDLNFIEEEDVTEQPTEIIPDHSVMGPKYKDKAKEIFSELEEMDPGKAYEGLDKGELVIETEDEKIKLDDEDIEIRLSKHYEGEEVDTLELEELQTTVILKR